MTQIKHMLSSARNKYDNELLKIETIWAKLKPYDYTHRRKLVKAASELIEIDRSLKMWEDKLK